MEEGFEKNSTMEATKPTENKILAIGDQVDCSVTKNSKENDHNFETEFRKRLKVLLLTVEDNTSSDFLWEWFGVVCSPNYKNPTRYYFYTGKSRPKYIILSTYVLNAKVTLGEIRKKLCEENWISENAVELSSKTKPSELHPNEYICQIVMRAIDAEHTKIFQFVNYLHRHTR